MQSRLDTIREEERKYHEQFYDNHTLFEPGSWLHKPVKTVMEAFSTLDGCEYVSILDLGSGVGRNSIPMAESLKGRDGRVVCVDLIESALAKLIQYSERYDVRRYIQTVTSDISDFLIGTEQFDYIVAVSALEHVRTEADFIQVLDRMVQGTKERGINCIIIGTGTQEIDMATGEALEPFFELNMPTEKAQTLISAAYAGWNVMKTSVKPLTFTIERNGRSILLTTDCLTYVCQRGSTSRVK